jgi:hypothetical protein
MLLRRFRLPFEPRDEAGAADGVLARERDRLIEKLAADWACHPLLRDDE